MAEPRAGKAKAKGKAKAGPVTHDETRSMDVVYERAEGFREVYITGAVGGATPRGDIHVAFYQDRHPYPRSATLKASPPQLETFTSFEPGDIVRVLQIGVTLDLPAARAIAKWLTHHADSLEKMLKEVEEGHS